METRTIEDRIARILALLDILCNDHECSDENQDLVRRSYQAISKRSVMDMDDVLSELEFITK